MGIKTHSIFESVKADIALANAMQENDQIENLNLEDATDYYQTLEKVD